MVCDSIKTEDEFEKVLSRIEKLMDAVPDTPEMAELERLTASVERYEDEHYPMSPPDPIAAIKFRMEQLGLTPENTPERSG